MNEQISMDVLLTNAHESLGVITLCGKEYSIKPLKFKKLKRALDLFGTFLLGIAMTSEVEVAEDIILEKMPIVLANSYAEPDTEDTNGNIVNPAKSNVLEFLNYFTDITEDNLEDFDITDVASLWEKIYNTHKVPFVSKLDEMRATNAINLMKEVLKRDLSISSTEQE